MTTKQSKQNSKIPRLRFPEFQHDGDWEEKVLEDLSMVIMGVSPSSKSYNDNKIGLPLIQGNSDIKDRKSSPRVYTSELTKECVFGDILLSVRAPVGSVAKSLHQACIGRGISAIRTVGLNSQEFLYQWLFSQESKWNKITQGGTFEAVNSSDIRNLTILTPKPQEQQKIASCLSSLDEVIEAHTHKLEQLKLHKKGLMQGLFPQQGEKVPRLRFPEFQHDGDWEEKDISSIGSVVTGNTPSKQDSNLWGNDFVWATAQDFKNKYILDSTQKLSQKGKSKCRVIPKNSVLVTCIASIGLNAINKVECSTNQQINSIICNSNFHYEFVYYSISHSQNRLRETAGQTAVPIISKSAFERFQINIPPLPEQEKIAACLSSLDEVIEAHTHKLEQLKLHKKGLMQGLFPQ